MSLSRRQLGTGPAPATPHPPAPALAPARRLPADPAAVSADQAAAATRTPGTAVPPASRRVLGDRGR